MEAQAYAVEVTVRRAWWLRAVDVPLRWALIGLVCLGLVSVNRAVDWYVRFSAPAARYRIGSGPWRPLTLARFVNDLDEIRSGDHD